MKGALLGPQQLKPTLAEVTKTLGVQGPIATVTAGWQEREDQDAELHEQLGRRTVNLGLYLRGEKVFAADPELAKLHRARQDKLRQMQDYYRHRLALTVDAALDISRLAGGTDLEDDEVALSIRMLRQLDKDHLKRCDDLRLEFDEKHKPLERDSLARHRFELAEIMKRCPTLVIAGGHVAVLLNRLRLFGLADFITEDHVLIAISGGAMVTSDRVMLFHESPPQGAGVNEVMDSGLNLHHGVVPLPNPKLRLKLGDPLRVGWFARRNEPRKCVAFDQGDYVFFDGRKYSGAVGTQLLKADGSVSLEWAS